jgi:hypothetical protein
MLLWNVIGWFGAIMTAAYMLIVPSLELEDHEKFEREGLAFAVMYLVWVSMIRMWRRQFQYEEVSNGAKTETRLEGFVGAQPGGFRFSNGRRSPGDLQRLGDTVWYSTGRLRSSYRMDNTRSSTPL